MEGTKDLEGVLMCLSDNYYTKGMSKITINVKGFRKDRISSTNRKYIIPQILKSNSRGNFIKDFLGNLSDEFDELEKSSIIDKLIAEPENYIKTVCEIDCSLLYLYFLSLNDVAKFENIMKLLVEKIEESQEKKCEEQVLDDIDISIEYKKIKEQCRDYEMQIKKLKELAKQRKDLIKELEISIKMKSDENEKRFTENKLLIEQNEKLKNEIEEFIETNEKANKKEKSEDINDLSSYMNVAILGINKLTVQTKIVECLMADINDILNISENEVKNIDIIMVNKQSIHISKMRKLKQRYAEKVLFFENQKELEYKIKVMEDYYENGIN